MNNRSSFVTRGVYGFAAVASLGVSASGNVEAAENESERNPLVLEEVVVTAQKREERLQDVPISLTVLDGDYLDRSTAEGLTGELGRVPGVAALSGAGSSAIVTVRGVSANADVGSGSSPTAYYLDSIPFGFVRNALVPDTSVYDLERVEVLRGPQGTLYGLSAQSGVVRVLTNDADLDEVELKTRGSISNTDDGEQSYRGDMALNLPIVEGKLAARAVVGYQNLSGWIDRPNKKNINDGEKRNLRFRINAQPTERLSIGLLSWFSRDDYNGLPFSNDAGQRPLSQVDELASTDFDAYGARVGYDFPWFHATSMTSYIDFSRKFLFDFRSFGLPVELQTNNRAEVFSQELNLVSTYEGPWRWSLGGIYRDGEERHFQMIPGLFVAPSDYTTGSESFAVFGELTRMFLDDQIELTVGLRYYEEEIIGREISRTRGVPATPANSDDEFDSLTPRAILTWHPSDDMTLYASYAEGFRSGLSQQPLVLEVAPQFPPADSDTLKSYEIGGKGILPGHINYSAAIYYADWQDVQQTVTVAINNSGLSASTVINGASASGIGLEFAATVEPVDSLTFGVNFAWNDISMDAEVFSAGVPLFSKGDRLNHSPKTTVGATADFAFPMGSSGLQGRLSASANYVGERTRRSVIAGTSVALDGDSLLVAGTSFSVGSPEHWTATLFVDNISNEGGAVSRDFFTPEWDTRLRPRTIGLQLDYRFGR